MIRGIWQTACTEKWQFGTGGVHSPSDRRFPTDCRRGFALQFTSASQCAEKLRDCAIAEPDPRAKGKPDTATGWRLCSLASHVQQHVYTMTIRRILFPVDFSERSRAVAPFVLSLAQRHKAEVVLMNVIQPAPPVYGGIGTDAIYPEMSDYRENRRVLAGILEEFGAAELPKVELKCVADVGDPAYLIVDYARDDAHGVDLICMATHGHGLFRRALLGSVTAKVLHDAHVPVWMDAHAPEVSHRAHPQPRHILVAIDPDKRARETLDAAVSIAAESSATLDIVTAVAEGMIAPGMADADLDGLLIEGTREMLAKLQFEAGTGAGVFIDVGGPAKVVRSAALSKRADLVIVGRSNSHGILARLQENSYSIIREAPCPVLSL